ncbi:hypothetical protein SDC9_200432 [bioreactor metagenome]|uniref:Uncharacterized protein n=1 Tax=bioreactor metagenome TaxID=1076179 RepID=A0A645IR09_9ZZZZ
MRNRTRVGRHSRAGVEPEPTEPQHKRADGRQTHIVAENRADFSVLGVFPEARP